MVKLIEWTVRVYRFRNSQETLFLFITVDCQDLLKYIEIAQV